MSDALPEEFLDDIKTALENLYDFPALQRHPLAQSAPTGEEPAGHRLRRELIAAIEALNPGGGVAVRSAAARLYNLLHMHYVGGMTLQEAANDLGISLRQAYRDLRRGQVGVGEILWFHRHRAPTSAQSTATPAQNLDVAEISSVQAEMRRLGRHVSASDINQTLQTALKAVGVLAEHHAVQFELALPAQPVVLSTNPVIARQVFIHVLSQVIQAASARRVQLTLTPANGHAYLTLYAEAMTLTLTPVIAHLLEQVKWTLHTDVDGLRLVMNTADPTVLIIDDNEGLVDLLKRYLTGQHYQVAGANSGLEGLRLLESLAPDVVILDLMMPEMDGWEVLQRIRTNPKTQALPVVICSVIHDPELAYSLGASVFIAKPVTKDRVLAALQDLGI